MICESFESVELLIPEDLYKQLSLLKYCFQGEMKLDLVDDQLQTPLHISAKEGHVSMVERLLEFG